MLEAFALKGERATTRRGSMEDETTRGPAPQESRARAGTQRWPGLWSAAALLAAALLTGCGGSSKDETAVSGGSPFLLPCTGACGGGLACIEGVCTKSCTDSSDPCASLAAGAECRLGADEARGTCDVACVDTADCVGLGSDVSPLRCAAGLCRAGKDPVSDVVPSGLTPSDGRCERDEDCALAGSAMRCVALVTGYRACLDQTPPTSEPSSNPTADQCDAERACPDDSACYAGLLYPSSVCGLGGATPLNACRADECDNDADCASGYCGPPGLDTDPYHSGGDIRRCVEARCRAHADCNARAGGLCALIDAYCGQPTDPEPIPGSANAYQPPRLACVYPDGCVRDADCPATTTCRLVDEASVCVARP
jgi:hypothetical protein